MKLAPFSRTHCLLSLVFLCGLWGASGALKFLPEARGADVRTYDADTHYFYYAWQENPRFVDTLKWWYGPWGQKHRPFYRPIPSLLFWTEYQVFGINGSWQFHVVLLLSHFLALLFIWRFLIDFLGEVMGTLTACVWGASIGHYFIWMAPAYALYEWKDSVESWHALAFTACLWAFLRFLKTNSRHWHRFAFFLFWLALCIKEMAYMAPFVLLLLCWHEKQFHEKWRAVIPFFLLAGLMFFFRLWALQGMGFRMIGNAAWKFRLINDNLGGAFTRAFNGDCLMLSLVLFLTGLWWLILWREDKNGLQRRKLLHGSLLIGLSVLLLLYTAYKSSMSVDENLSRLLVAGEYEVFPLLIVMLFFWWRCFINRNTSQIFGALFALIVYAPLTSGANTAHIYYYPSLGWSIWFAYGLSDVYSTIRDFWTKNIMVWKKTQGAT